MIEVVAAIIEENGKFLCVQRGEHKFDYLSRKFEFPGGKVETDEDAVEALKREIREELHIDVVVHDKISIVEHVYPDFSIRMAAYLCSIHSGELKLTEHISKVWLSINELDDLDWAAADIPIVRDLVTTKTQHR